MKASSWLLIPLKPVILLHLLVLVPPGSMSVAVSGSSPQIKYEGVVGGNVTFYCPVKHPEKLQFLYLQKGNDFVNGYYHTRDVPSPWSNTKMDHSNTAIRMYGLNLSHTGEYDCLYMYNDNTAEHMSVKLHLSITATFSKPKITKRCKDDDVPVGCYVTCTSHSGYPSQKITWQTEHGHSQMWKELNNSEVLSNPTTKMINVSSTGYMNCSSGEMMVTCSVGNISSVKISVCAPPPSPSNHLTTVVVGVIVVCLVVSGVIAWLILKKRKTAAAPRSVTANGSPLEVKTLVGNTNVEEAR